MNEVEKELSAQIKLVKDSGIRISHLDSHKHLHQLTGISKVAGNLAKKFGIQRIRCTLEPIFWNRKMDMKKKISRLIRILFANMSRRQFKTMKLRFPHRTFDITELMAVNNKVNWIRSNFSQGSIVEMFCHPGTLQADLQKFGSCERYRELQFLQSKEFQVFIEDPAINLITCWDY